MISAKGFVIYCLFYSIKVKFSKNKLLYELKVGHKVRETAHKTRKSFGQRIINIHLNIYYKDFAIETMQREPSEIDKN